MEKLFSYGTLRDDHVQRAVFGRSVAGTPDTLVGYRLKTVTITDPSAIAISGKSTHLILEASGQDGDRIDGVALQITEQELALADAYEDAAYKRVLGRLASGGEAWVYVEV